MKVCQNIFLNKFTPNSFYSDDDQFDFNSPDFHNMLTLITQFVLPDSNFFSQASKSFKSGKSSLDDEDQKDELRQLLSLIQSSAPFKASNLLGDSESQSRVFEKALFLPIINSVKGSHEQLGFLFFMINSLKKFLERNLKMMK